MAAKNRFNPIDCLGAALPDEEYWLLLARDPAMPAMLGIWASLRVGNLKAASENFMLLMAPDLVRHYQNHPDIAKSEETVETANRAAEWRERNLTAGPGGTPSWKQSLVRPKMLDLEVVSGCELAIVGDDPRTGRPCGDHGTAEQAIRYALDHAGNECQEFLQAWNEGALDEWPEFYPWLAAQEGSDNARIQ
jgi:hypothetical protein